MMKIKKILPSICLILMVIVGGCTSFLDVKSDKKLTVPTNLDDFEAILNHSNLILEPAEGEVMTTDYYLKEDDYQGMFCQLNMDLYKWLDNPFIAMCDGSIGWHLNYGNIYRSNVVIEGMKDHEQTLGDSMRAKSIKGYAYFVRGINHLGIAQLWTRGYEENKANSELGIPLKLTADFNQPTTRASLKETMRQIEEDLLKAAELLPDKQVSVRYPTKMSAWAYLARFYLYLSDFEKAKRYAKLCIDSGLELIDFNTLSFTGAFPFNLDTNREVLYARVLTTSYESLSINTRRIDKDLYSSYDAKDLRKSTYFTINSDSTIRFRGSYSGGGGGLFSGPALDEMYLIAAECHARQHSFEKAKEYLFRLLKMRMATDYVFPHIENDEILNKVLTERRKELILRGIRFCDLKRLNTLGANISMERTVQSVKHVLTPNSPSFALLIPQNVVEISGIQQNLR